MFFCRGKKSIRPLKKKTMKEDEKDQMDVAATWMTIIGLPLLLGLVLILIVLVFLGPKKVTKLLKEEK
jgi:hypothetical protein